jgi:hypothetical protein
MSEKLRNHVLATGFARFTCVHSTALATRAVALGVNWVIKMALVLGISAVAHGVN